MEKLFLASRFTIYCFFVLLNACGGGGGSHHSSSNPPAPGSTPAQSSTAFIVESVNPSNNATDVGRSQQLVVAFNQAANANSLSANISLVESSGVSIPLDFSINGKQVVITPEYKLHGGVEYQLKISAALLSTSGKNLQGDYVSKFTTAPMQWLGMQEHLDWNANQLVIKENAAGKKIAIWIQYMGNSYSIFASQYDNGAWSLAQAIDNSGNVNPANKLALAIDAQGNAMAVWEKSVSAMYGIYAAHFSNGTWSSPINIASTAPSAGNAGSPAITVDTAGLFTIVWQQQLSADAVIFMSQFKGYWISYSRIDNPGLSFSSHPDVAVTSSGDVVVVWRQLNGARAGIYARRLMGSVLWSSTVEIDDPAGDNADTPVISTDGAGGATVAWRQIDPSQSRNVIYARRFSNGNWGQATRIDDSTASIPPNAPVLSSDVTGNVTAVWSQYNGMRDEIRSSRFENGAWSVPIQLDDPALGGAQSPALTTDSVGSVTVVWQQYTGTHLGVYSNRLQLGVWQGSTELSTTDPSNGPANLNIATDLTGAVDAVWTNNGVVVSNRLE